MSISRHASPPGIRRLPAWATLVAALALLVAPAAGASEDTLPDGAALMDRSRAALGDEARLDALGDVVLRGTARWEGHDGSGTVVESHGSGDRSLKTMAFDPFGTFDLGSDGTIVWEANPLGVTVREGWSADQYRRSFAVTRNASWRELYESAACVGSEEKEGRSCWKLELTPRPPADAEGEGTRDTWWLDAETLLPVRIELRAPTEQGEPIDMTLLPSDWRAVDGVQFAHRMGMRVSGFMLNTEYDAIELHARMSDALFVPSEAVLAALERERSGTAAMADDEIRIEVLEEQHIASIRVTCDHAEMQRNLAVILPEVMRHVMASSLQMQGQPLVRYHDFGEPIDMEGAIPISGPIEPAGRMVSETLPAGPAAVAWHVGPYEKLGDTHTRLMAFLEAEELVARGPCWEQYWTDPGMEPDPNKWRTLVVWPVMEKK